MLGLRRSAEFSANSLKPHKYNLWFKFASHQTRYVFQGKFSKIVNKFTNSATQCKFVTQKSRKSGCIPSEAKNLV